MLPVAIPAIKGLMLLILGTALALSPLSMNDMVQKPTDEKLRPGAWIIEGTEKDLIEKFGDFNVVVKKYEGPREIVPMSRIDEIPADNIREVFIVNDPQAIKTFVP